MKVLLDANFLMLAGKRGSRIFEELERFGKCELFTLDVVEMELERIRDKGGKKSVMAAIGLEAIKSKGIRVIKTGKDTKDTDSEIVRIAAERGFLVCTEDRKLRKELARKGVEVIGLRQGRYLVRMGSMERE